MKINNILTSKGNVPSKKYVFEEEGKLIESTYIDRKNKYIICVSCMFGCPVGCEFCASGLNYFGKLTKKEMVFMISSIIKKENLTEEKRLLISFMGSGEPSLNMNEIKEVIQEISNKYPNTSFAISNSGVKIENLLLLNDIKDRNIKLQFSLHSPYNQERKKIIPSTDNLKKILKTYFKLKFELEINYILLNNFNDSRNHADKLSNFIKKYGFNLKINDYHEVNRNFIESTNKKLFLEVLKKNKVNFEMYSTDGVDIGAACGQLISKKTK